jgi:glycosyltransferase-like protein
VYHAEDCLVASGLLEARSTPRLSPVVRTLHHWEHFESAYLRACQRRSVLEADDVVCVSRSSQRDVVRELGRRCSIIGNGVDVERFEHRDLARERALRGKLGIALADPVVLSVGGVEPRKNSLRALEAMSGVLAENPRLFYVIAGGSSIWEHAAYRAEFQARLSLLEPALRARVLELGPVAEAELTTLYGLSDVLLCPSTREGFGLCVLEALAAKCAVVVSEGEPFSEYLDASTASFVHPESAPAIGEAVRQLVASPALRAERSAAGRGRASEYSWQRVAALHERWYDELLSRRYEARSAAQKEAIHA